LTAAVCAAAAMATRRATGSPSRQYDWSDVSTLPNTAARGSRRNTVNDSSHSHSGGAGAGEIELEDVAFSPRATDNHGRLPSSSSARYDDDASEAIDIGRADAYVMSEKNRAAAAMVSKQARTVLCTC
jgi:hypothetical protein